METNEAYDVKDIRDYSLLGHNTFGIDAKCSRFLEYADETEARQVAKILREEGQPFLIVGGGSNLLLTRDFEGLVVHSAMMGCEVKGCEMTCGSGVVGELSEPMEACDFVQKVKNLFNVECAMSNELLQRPVRKVALCGGAGDFLLDDAIALGADAFITGEMHYHQYFGHEQQIQICVIGHYQSEQYTSEVFQEIIEKECPEVRTEIAETNTNPIFYF